MYFLRILENWIYAIIFSIIKFPYWLLSTKVKNIFVTVLVYIGIGSSLFFSFMYMPANVIIVLYVFICLIYAIVKTYKEQTMIEKAHLDYCINYNRSRNNSNTSGNNNQSDNKQSRQNTTQSNTGAYSHFFEGCKTKEDARKRRNELIKIYHPDQGMGTGEMIKMINEQYDDFISTLRD